MKNSLEQAKFLNWLYYPKNKIYKFSTRWYFSGINSVLLV